MSKTDPDIETRMTVFNRDHGRCFICGRTLSAYAFDLHHRRMRSHAWEGVNYRDDERRGLDVSVVPVILL